MEFLNFEQSISGDYGHLVSSDGGETLCVIIQVLQCIMKILKQIQAGSIPNFPSSYQLWLPPLMEHPHDNNKVYLGGGGLNGVASFNITQKNNFRRNNLF